MEAMVMVFQMVLVSRNENRHMGVVSDVISDTSGECSSDAVFPAATNHDVVCLFLRRQGEDCWPRIPVTVFDGRFYLQQTFYSTEKSHLYDNHRYHTCTDLIYK